MSDIKVTCTDINCPERQGGECQMANDPQLAVTQFLIESNRIEGVTDPESLEQAERAWKYLMKQEVLTSGVILKTHKILMLHQHLQPNEKGYWRRCDVQVGYYLAPNWRSVPMLMGQWVFETMRKFPKVDAKKLHVDFEKIHPFVDGNGRIGRMLMNWTRIKRNDEPLLIIYDSGKQRYYDWFN